MRHLAAHMPVLLVSFAIAIAVSCAPSAAALPALAQSQARPPGAQSMLPNTAVLKRALVIGNGAYAIGRLDNARGDATLIAESLRKIGFEVTMAKDLNRTAMFEAVRTFAASLPAGAASVVYFAGHGMQIDGQNYLVPVDMVPTSAVTAGLRSVPLKVVYEQLAGARSKVNVIILDACRDNPFGPRVASASRSIGPLGLAPSQAPRGTLIAYATAPGQQAADGSGRRHSLYSEALAELLVKDGLPAEELFKLLADRVRRVTLEDQQPWYESSLVGTFYFGAPMTTSDEPQIRQSPKVARSDGKRSIHATPAGDLPTGHSGAQAWHRRLGELEWTELDNQLSQRAANASEDQIPALQAQARKNNVVAMTTLAMLYRAGIGSGRSMTSGQRYRIAPNLSKAVALYRKAAALGFPVAQAELGEMLYRGREVDMDRAAGQRLLEQAGEANYPRAKIDLAEIRLEKSGSPEDMATLMKQMFEGSTKVQDQLIQRRTVPN